MNANIDLGVATRYLLQAGEAGEVSTFEGEGGGRTKRGCRRSLRKAVHAEVHELLNTEALSGKDREALEAFHPMFMGGNYLPDTEDGEVEIGKISIKSTTYDVTCVYARPDRGVIHYRVLDEYGGDALQGPDRIQTDEPLTLGEFAEFFLGAWSLIDVLEMNFDGDLEGALRFFSTDSDFYPDFDRLCRQRVHEHFACSIQQASQRRSS